MSSMTFDAASKTAIQANGSGTTTSTVEARLKITSTSDPTNVVWSPANQWQSAIVQGGNWSVMVPIPMGAPSPATYKLIARITGGGSKELSKDL